MALRPVALGRTQPSHGQGMIDEAANAVARFLQVVAGLLVEWLHFPAKAKDEPEKDKREPER